MVRKAQEIIKKKIDYEPDLVDANTWAKCQADWETYR